MAQITTKIKLYTNREIDFTKDVRLQDNSDGKGVFIAEWNLDIPKPTLEQLDAFEAQAIEYEQLQDILNNRRMAYPSIADQLDMLYWDKVNGTENWLNSIESVKSRFPKA
jgi:signal transduction protein with GAF and PtsI domain